MTYNPTRQLLTGIAQLLADNDIALWTPDTPYADTDTGVVMKTMPDSPDRCVVLNWAPMGASPTIPHLTGLLQCACRGGRNDPMDADDLADQCEGVLDGLTRTPMGGCTVSMITLRNVVNMGQDELKRYITAVQLDVELDVPPTALRPETGAWN